MEIPLVSEVFIDDHKRFNKHERLNLQDEAFLFGSSGKQPTETSDGRRTDSRKYEDKKILHVFVEFRNKCVGCKQKQLFRNRTNCWRFQVA